MKETLKILMIIIKRVKIRKDENNQNINKR